MNFIGILWPASVDFTERILRYIDNQYVSTYEVYSFKNDKDFRKFAVGIYKPDNTPSKRINKKIKAMKRYKKKIVIFKAEVPTPKMIAHTKSRLKGTYYCKEMKTLKKEIRNAYKDKIKKYVHDIIIHISDNEDHNIRIMELLKKYAQEIN